MQVGYLKPDHCRYDLQYVQPALGVVIFRASQLQPITIVKGELSISLPQCPNIDVS